MFHLTLHCELSFALKTHGNVLQPSLATTMGLACTLTARRGDNVAHQPITEFSLMPGIQSCCQINSYNLTRVTDLMGSLSLKH